jgi:hypothetical protein
MAEAAEAGGALSSGAWLSRARARAASRVLLVAQLGLLGFAIAGTHGWIVEVPPLSTAYVSFYAAGTFALQGTPALAYDAAAHHALEQAITLPGIDYKYFFYPPVYLLLCAVLALPPYLLSFLLFEFASLGLLLAVLRRVLAGTGPGWLVAALAFPALFWNLGWGQNAFLTAGLMGAGLCLLERRPFLAGLVLAGLCYKPHFGLLLPVALIAAGQWRAVAGAAAGVAGLAGLSLLVFGVETWLAYLEAARGSAEVYRSGTVNLAFYVTPFGAALLLGAPAWLAYGAQALASLLAAACVAWLWRGGADLPTRAAGLLAATLLAVPLALLYDLMLLLLALAFLLRASLLPARGRAGFLPWEKTLAAAIWLSPLGVVSLGMGLGLPIGPLAPAAMLVLALRRAARQGGATGPGRLGAAPKLTV